MFSISLHRVRCLFLVALLSTAAPLSHAAVEVITFGDTQSSLQSVTTDNISVGDSVSTDAITLRSGDMVKLNIDSWGGPQNSSYGPFNAKESYPGKNRNWDGNVMKQIAETLKVNVDDVTTLCKNFTAYPAKHASQGGIQLDLSNTHNSGDMVDIFLLGHLWGNETLPYDIGFTSNLAGASLTYAKEDHVQFFDSKNKDQAPGQSFICLHLHGSLEDDCTVNIPLSCTLNNTTYQPYALGAVFYSYTPAQTPAPEPSTAMLTLLALTALALRRRRRLN